MNLKGLFQDSLEKWVVAYVTQNLADYYRAVGVLKSRGMKYKVKTLGSGGGALGRNNVSCTFQILVPKNSIRQTQNALDGGTILV